MNNIFNTLEDLVYEGDYDILGFSITKPNNNLLFTSLTKDDIKCFEYYYIEDLLEWLELEFNIKLL